MFPNSISSCGHTTFSLSIRVYHSLMKHAMNTYVYKSLWVDMFSFLWGRYLGLELLHQIACVNSIFFFKNREAAFQGSSSILYFSQQYKRVLLWLCPCQHWIFSLFHSDQFSCSVMSDSLPPHGLRHTRFPCPSPTPGACSNSCSSSR